MTLVLFILFSMSPTSEFPRHPEASDLDHQIQTRIQELVLSGTSAKEAIRMAGEEFRERSLELVTGKLGMNE